MTRQARAQRARRAVGVERQQDSESGSEALEASTPALAQTKPWRVRQIKPARVRAHELRGLRQDDLDVPRVLVVLGGERERALARA